MKLVQDLPEIFEEFGEKKREAFLEIKEYKDMRGKNTYVFFRKHVREF